MNFIVLSSSRGTTFQSTLDAIERGDLQARCIGLVTNRADAGCIDKARNANVPVAIVEPKPQESAENYDKRLHAEIMKLVDQQANSQFSILHSQFCVAAMGWMRILTPWFIRQWTGRILNVHPALLPKYGGKGMFGDRVHQAVLDAKEKESGITIHLMDEGIDTGPILLQKKCAVEPGDTVETLRNRVQALEREWYPKVLQMIHTGELSIPSNS